MSLLTDLIEIPIYFIDSGVKRPPLPRILRRRRSHRLTLLHSLDFHLGSREDPAPDNDVLHLMGSSSDPTADYDKAYHRSGYDSAHSSAGSLASLGM